MIRVCCTVGTWQLVTLAAALQQVAHDLKKENGSEGTARFDDYLVVYETGGVPDSFKQTLQQMAEAIWPWKRIIWAYDLLTSEGRLKQGTFTRLCRTLQKRVGVPPQQVKQVWTCWLTRPAEKIVFQAFPRARIMLYEDGLISYLPVPMAEKLQREGSRMRQRMAFWAWQAAAAAVPVVRLRRSRGKIDPQHLARVDAAYLLLTPSDAPLPETLAHVPRYGVGYEQVRHALACVVPITQATAAAAAAAAPTGAEPETEATPRSRVLVLGQALSRNGIMERDEERNIYQSIVQNILGKGYTVLWKEHPRISHPFFAEIKQNIAAHLGQAAASRLHQLSLPHAFPVELAAETMSLAACVAGTSAALFYLRRLYNIPCYTFAEDLLPRMQGADVFMNDMVRREAPPLSSLPPPPLHLMEPNALAENAKGEKKL